METPRIRRKPSRQSSEDSGIASPQYQAFRGTPLERRTQTALRTAVFRRSTRRSERQAQMEPETQSELELADPNSRNFCSFWVMCFFLFTACGSSIAGIWYWFPDHDITKDSQMYVMLGLSGFAGCLLLVLVIRLAVERLGQVRVSRRGPALMAGEPELDDYDSVNNDSPTEDTELTRMTPINYVNNQDNTSETANIEPVPRFLVDSTTKEPNQPGRDEVHIRRVFNGGSNETWFDFLQYFSNIAELNQWGTEKSRRVLMSTFRGQAESYAYGLPLVIQRNYERLLEKMEQRFGHTVMKEHYIAEAKLRHRNVNESLRDFGQALEDLYRRAYPNSPDLSEEPAITAFLGKCGRAEEFRLAVKRTKPTTLHQVVLNAMEEECMRLTETDPKKTPQPLRPVLGVDVSSDEVAPR